MRHDRTPGRSAAGATAFAAALTLAAVFLAVPPAGAQVYPPGFNDELAVQFLTVPTCFVFPHEHPDHMFVGEQRGTVRLVENGIVQPQPMLSLAVETFREQGLLGMALDPQWPLEPYLYLVYTPHTGSTMNNHHRVSRFTVNGDTIDPESELVLFDEIPTGIGYHVGGCIRFGTDGNLLITSGDTNWAPPYPQDLTRLEGKLLRLTPDGSVPPDNPFVGVAGARPEIYQYGLRNPFRFSVQPGTGLAFIGDVGASEWEEINVGPPGANFGWPIHEGPADPADSTMTDPLFAYRHFDGSSGAVVGSAFYQGTNFPTVYEGNLFFFDHVRGSLGRMQLDAQNAIVSVDTAWAVVPFAGAGFGPVDMQVGPDGALYYSTYIPGQIRRISYSGGDNRRPNAIASATGPTNGYADLTVGFSGQLSFDADDDTLAYDWNFGDGSPHSTEQNPAHTYTFNGIYPVTLTVDDGRGGVAISTPIQVTVGNLGPIVQIDTPLNGALFTDGQQVTFSGSAADPELGPLPAEALHWRVLLHHGTHVHPVIIDAVGASGSFEGSFHQEEPEDIYYSITASATDANGLRSERTVNVHPDPNNPTGILRVFSVQASDRDAVCVSGETRLVGYHEGKPIDYVSNDAEQMSAGVQVPIDLPATAVILEARLLLTPGPLQLPSTNGALAIRCYDVSDAAPFVEGPGEILAHHPLLPQVVEWPAPPMWFEGNQVESPDLSGFVQAFLARPDYAPGNHLGFVLEKGTIDYDSFYGWTDYASLSAPTRLRVVYTNPTSTGETPRPRLALGPCVPNPFNPSARIEFSLASPGPARMEIVDVRGRLVRVLHDGRLPAGPHARRWDGRDTQGRSAASGVYVCRLVAGDATRALRLTLVR